MVFNKNINKKNETRRDKIDIKKRHLSLLAFIWLSTILYTVT